MVGFDAGHYEVIVVGAGHAGSEAALASARMGVKTLMITMNLEMIAHMPCNPSIGGPAKGVVVREVDALGGEMGRNIDRTAIQMRLLNTSKGPAVQALRAQADKYEYSHAMKVVLEHQENLDVVQGLVEELIMDEDKVAGVVTNTGARYFGEAVVITTGTSSRGKIFIGELNYEAGPGNTLPSVKLSENLLALGIELIRFKTGTPPRVHYDSIHFEETERQDGDLEMTPFSYMTPDEDVRPYNVPCWLTHTNEKTHDIINHNLHRTPMFTGLVSGVGARYCPSIEDKVVRFGDKPRHQIFIEPEGLQTKEMYIQGLSTSLPEDIQLEMLHSMEGLGEARITRPGYAIEYDVVVPHQLKPNLELKKVEGLFTAGQMNGTSGYEEAAGQGIMAGINAALKVQGKEPFILRRDEAYIGVMIDDLVTKGTIEPYRLLTSRAEYRLLLRHDNADIRLTKYGHELGIIDDERYEGFTEKLEAIEEEKERLSTIRLTPHTPGIDAYFERVKSTPLKDGILAIDLLKRPEIKYKDLVDLCPRPEGPVDRQVGEQVEIQVKYEGYIEKALRKVKKVESMERKLIPSNLAWDAIGNLALEARERLELINPRTLGQATRISGVTPSDIAILSVYLSQPYSQMKTTDGKEPSFD